LLGSGWAAQAGAQWFNEASARQGNAGTAGTFRLIRRTFAD
jgi:hypothetical protein